MSSKAVYWAWQQQVKPASAKLLLMALADFTNSETGLCWPSIAALIQMTCQDRKTVFSGLERLKEMGVIVDTGKKTGRTGQITVYRMTFTIDIGETVPKTEPFSETVPKTGPLKGERVPKTDGKSPVFPIKESRKRDTEPIKEPSKEEESNHYDDDFGETDLFGQPVLTPEQRAALERADTIQKIEEGWRALAAAVPAVAALRGGKLDDTRADAAIQRAEKFAGEGETAADIWQSIFREIQSSRWLCGETRPRDGRPPFKLQMTWLLENRNFTKVLEGKFNDGRNPDIAGGGTPERHSPAREVATSVLERALARRQRRAAGGNSGGADTGGTRGASHRIERITG